MSVSEKEKELSQLRKIQRDIWNCRSPPAQQLWAVLMVFRSDAVVVGFAEKRAGKGCALFASRPALSEK